MSEWVESNDDQWIDFGGIGWDPHDFYEIIELTSGIYQAQAIDSAITTTLDFISDLNND